MSAGQRISPNDANLSEIGGVEDKTPANVQADDREAARGRRVVPRIVRRVVAGLGGLGVVERLRVRRAARGVAARSQVAPRRADGATPTFRKRALH